MSIEPSLSITTMSALDHITTKPPTNSTSLVGFTIRKLGNYNLLYRRGTFLLFALVSIKHTIFLFCLKQSIYSVSLAQSLCIPYQNNHICKKKNHNNSREIKIISNIGRSRTKERELTNKKNNCNRCMSQQYSRK